MKSEYYNVDVFFKGNTYNIPVSIDYRSGATKISAVVDGIKIGFQQDDHRDGLRPLMAVEDVDPELYHLIGAAICKEHALRLHPPT